MALRISTTFSSLTGSRAARRRDGGGSHALSGVSPRARPVARHFAYTSHGVLAWLRPGTLAGTNRMRTFHSLHFLSKRNRATKVSALRLHTSAPRLGKQRGKSRSPNARVAGGGGTPSVRKVCAAVREAAFQKRSFRLDSAGLVESTIPSTGDYVRSVASSPR